MFAVNVIFKRLIYNLLKALSAVYLFLFCVTAFANVQQDAQQEHFSKGVWYSNHQNYQQALIEFEAAQQAGMDSPVIIYNLAVIYYKLGEFNNATHQFSLLLNNNKYSALASYNLGLIALIQDKLLSAETYFKIVIKNSSNTQLIDLSKKALKRIDASSAQNNTNSLISENISGYVSIGLSADNNIALANEEAEESTKVSDTARKLYGAVDSNLIGDKNTGLDVNVALYRLDYSDSVNSIYNYASNRLSIDKNTKIHQWDSKIRFSYGTSKYGDPDYLTVFDFQVSGKRHFQNKNYFRIKYKYSSIDPDTSSYAYLKGDRHKLDIDLTLPLNKHKYRIGLIGEINDRDDFSRQLMSISYVAQRSYSPTRMTLFGVYYYRLNKNLRFRAEFQYRNSQYSSDDVIKLYDPVSEMEEDFSYQRVDHRIRVKLGTTYNINKDWSMALLYEYFDNESNRQSLDATDTRFNSLTYKRNISTFSVNYSF